MGNLSIRCFDRKTPGQELCPPQRSSASMSFSWLFLGEVVSTRARLRFTNRGQHAVNSVRRSSLLQRTANYLLTVCLTPGGKRKVTFPRAPLQSRKVGFPDSGFGLGFPREVFPRQAKLKCSLTSTPTHAGLPQQLVLSIKAPPTYVVDHT